MTGRDDRWVFSDEEMTCPYCEEQCVQREAGVRNQRDHRVCITCGAWCDSHLVWHP
jgi:predicted RNA-binding Zn-ribbon protein involved in translation (DUF1610 family)